MATPSVKNFVKAPHRIKTRSLRWLALLTASLLLHLIVLSWTHPWFGASLESKSPTIVPAHLLAAPPAPLIATRPAPMAAPQTKKPLAARKTGVPLPRALPTPPAEPPVTAPPLTSPEAPALAGMEAPGTSVEGVTELTPATAAAAQLAAPGPDSAPAAATSPTVTSHKVHLPPSVTLQYQVQALRDGQQWQGNGAFRWEMTGDRYAVTGEASITVLFKLALLNLKSTGTIKEFGIAPLLYSEKPFRKSETHTHFQHEHHKISFSASQASYPYQGGEQDRVSIIWQLAGIGRADPVRFQPGSEIDIFVAGARNAETWHIRVLGQEEVDTPYGKMNAWHMVRAPRAGSYDEKLDIWLAPEQEWHPVKIRYTYANGGYVEMSLAQINFDAKL